MKGGRERDRETEIEREREREREYMNEVLIHTTICM
jgi:hypothetical protein